MNREEQDQADTAEAVLAEFGVQHALRFLNELTPHRFTGVYRFDHPVLRNLRLFDRENPELEIGADSPLRETYCSIVGEQQAPFFTPDAARDARLGEHPAREHVVSYTGVLLRDEHGVPFGTLCHFDLRPQPVPRETIGLLEHMAPLILRAVLNQRDARTANTLQPE